MVLHFLWAPVAGPAAARRRWYFYIGGRGGWATWLTAVCVRIRMGKVVWKRSNMEKGFVRFLFVCLYVVQWIESIFARLCVEWKNQPFRLFVFPAKPCVDKTQSSDKPYCVFMRILSYNIIRMLCCGAKHDVLCKINELWSQPISIRTTDPPALSKNMYIHISHTCTRMFSSEKKTYSLNMCSISLTLTNSDDLSVCQNANLLSNIAHRKIIPRVCHGMWHIVQ